MSDFKSNITRILSRVKDYHLGILAANVVKGLNVFIQDKLREEGKILSGADQDKILKDREMIETAENLLELDAAISNFEETVSSIIQLKPGELEFAVVKYLQQIFKEVEELSKELRRRHPGDLSERNMEIEPKEKKESRVLPFDPNRERGRH